MDRYAYVSNAPMRYTDPSGHRPCEDAYDCGRGSYNPPRLGKCSVLTGAFNGNFTCTAADLNRATIAQRKGWFNKMLASVNPELPEEFANINGILNAFIATDTGAPGTWASWGDAGILASIQNGLALSIGETYNPGFDQADQAWNDYFESFRDTGRSNETLRLWGAAEAEGTRYGRLLAMQHDQKKTTGEMLFLAVGDVYRQALLNRQDPETMRGPQWSANLYGWTLDTSSTIEIPFAEGEAGIPPVSIVAYVLLQWK